MSQETDTKTSLLRSLGANLSSDIDSAMDKALRRASQHNRAGAGITYSELREELTTWGLEEDVFENYVQEGTGSDSEPVDMDSEVNW